MALRRELPFELIRVFGPTHTMSLAHLQKPNIAPAELPTSRKNRTSYHSNTEGVPGMLTTDENLLDIKCMLNGRKRKGWSAIFSQSVSGWLCQN